MQDANTIKTIGRYSYYTQKCLGEGSFGKVFEGFQNTTKQKVAIKKVDFKTIEKDVYLQKAIHDQIRILSKFKHPNIVQLHEVLNSKRSLYIIMDYCKDGDLKKYLRKREKLPQIQAFAVMKQIITGYQQLARQNTIHRDLKPANILISNNQFKICDFGFSKVIKDPNTSLKTCVGSPIYMAPQILQKKDYSAKCDIWSLGIIYYEMLHGVVPWTARSQKELLQKIKTEQFVVKTSPATQKIIKQMLEVNQQKRATLRDLECFFGIESQSSLTSNMKWDQIAQPSQLTPSQGSLASQSPSVSKPEVPSNRSLTTIQAKVLNRNYFEELAFRFFVSIELRTSLDILNRYNFKQNVFQRYIVLIIGSIISNYRKREQEIKRIHEREVVDRVEKEFESYREFQNQFFEYLGQKFATCQILKEFDLIDVATNNYTEESMKRAQMDLNKHSQTILKQLQQQIKSSPAEQPQRLTLLYLNELILDMILLNERQAKVGAADIDAVITDRMSGKTVEKRIASKLTSLKEVRITQFY